LLTWADFRAGRDPAMAAILQDIARREHAPPPPPAREPLSPR
jgi:hypothetical protein